MSNVFLRKRSAKVVDAISETVQPRLTGDRYLFYTVVDMTETLDCASFSFHMQTG